MLLTGTFRRSVDEKQRIAIPKKLRTALEAEGGGEATERSLYLTPGTDGSLGIYSAAAFARLSERLAERSPTGQDQRAFRRLFYAQAHSAEMDAQGRVRIEPELVQLAGLASEVVMVGVGDHIELWDVQRWEDYRQQQQARYDELAERAFE